MKPDARFRYKDKSFWAAVRIIGQEIGYTARGKGQVKVPTLKEIHDCFEKLDLDASTIAAPSGSATAEAKELIEYFSLRARALNEYVEPRLMDVDRAKKEFSALRRRLRPQCPIPMNKQKGEKKTPAYFTGMVNMIIESQQCGMACDYDPRELTVVTRDGFPLRTLARRIDGAFPSAVNPIAVWEIKEYYYTTTFGSRVDDDR